jgi:hypothetical protein
MPIFNMSSISSRIFLPFLIRRKNQRSLAHFSNLFIDERFESLRNESFFSLLTGAKSPLIYWPENKPTYPQILI